MTATTATAKSKEWAEARPERAIRKPDDTAQIVRRLLGYLAERTFDRSSSLLLYCGSWR